MSITTAGTRQTGCVIAAHGRHYLIKPDSGAAPIQGFPKGKKSELAVGDQIAYEDVSADQCTIVEVLPRRNLLYRSDQFKSKSFAANLDQLLIVVATDPWFSDDLLGRALIAATAHELIPRIVLNKIDLEAHRASARLRLSPFREMGYDVVEASVATEPDAAREMLQPWLRGRATLLLGQSGMGKSSLVNMLVPGAQVATREISAALGTGKHTTTFTRLYELPGGGALIDSPGFQEFGLHHLTEGELERGFPDFQPYLHACRFYNCRHLHEPGCAILGAVASGLIASQRHRLYAQLTAQARGSRSARAGGSAG